MTSVVTALLSDVSPVMARTSPPAMMANMSNRIRKIGRKRMVSMTTKGHKRRRPWRMPSCQENELPCNLVCVPTMIPPLVTAVISQMTANMAVTARAKRAKRPGVSPHEATRLKNASGESEVKAVEAASRVADVVISSVAKTPAKASHHKDGVVRSS